jgi:two-component system response regulator FixJ
MMFKTFPQTAALFVLGLFDTSTSALALCCTELKLKLRFFSDAEDFLAETLQHSPDCLIIDLDEFPNAAVLQADLARHGYRGTVIAAASDLDVDTAIKVMEQGALTVLKKPLELESSRAYLKNALVVANHDRELHVKYLSFAEKQAGLTPRQCNILWSVLEGLPTKAIAAKLDVSNRLVELERSRLLKVFGADSTTELALKVGEFLTLQRAFTHLHAPHFSRLRVTAERPLPHSPDEE